ncbi:MAG: THUMP domain-containing protein [Desulfobulbaceae bacterium]|nr:THUMP domain-containing protein [Desulfobulbaceae bacterium]
MNDWNVVITVHERNLAEGLALLGGFGRISRTEYFNVVVMQVDNPRFLLEKLREQALTDPGLHAVLARVVPAAHTFNFQSPEDFEEKAKNVVVQFVPELTGKKFYVRMHRRGFKGRLSSMQEEKFLADLLLAALDLTGSPGAIEFDNPDSIISIETVGQRAGFSLWSREDLNRYPLLGLD